MASVHPWFSGSICPSHFWLKACSLEVLIANRAYQSTCNVLGHLQVKIIAVSSYALLPPRGRSHLSQRCPNKHAVADTFHHRLAMAVDRINIWSSMSWTPIHWTPIYAFITSPPEGVARYIFYPFRLCVCLSVCPANILVFYFSAIRRYIALKCIQDTYMVVLNSLKKWTFIGQRSRSQGRYIYFWRYSHITKTEL